MNQNKITIAIDGFSSCGKSTLAKALAKKLGYLFIDTGAMYRAITYFFMKKGLVRTDLILHNEILKEINNVELHFEKNEKTGTPEIYLNSENVENKIRNLEVSSFVSKVASIKEVRQKLVKIQQEIGLNGGVVMDGRDIGSVVFPNAEIKFFITAKPETRARRRLLELNDSKVTFEDVLLNIKERDFMDTTRKESPLIKVQDAIEIDNTEINQEKQLEIALMEIKSKYPKIKID